LIRTVWLGLVLLVGLTALASFKLAFSLPRPVQAAEEPEVPAPNQAMATGDTTAAPEALMKSDRLPITFVKPDTDAKAIDVDYTPDQPSLPAAAGPKIVSRHWHDPSDQKSVQTQAKKPKLKEARHDRPSVASDSAGR
jgi:hypothetical protein